MNFYCQLDYPHIPYPSPSSPNGNISNNGCGVCCASMMIEGFTGKLFPIEECAKFAKASGAREGFGTNLAILAPAIQKRFGIHYKYTMDPKAALEFLKAKKGYVIANTFGDREDYIGVFSDSRHFILLCGYEDGLIPVADPMYQPGSGRYDKPGRKGKVTFKNGVPYAPFSVIEADCFGKPYYLFWAYRKELLAHETKEGKQ